MAKRQVSERSTSSVDPYQTPLCVEFHRTIELIGKRWTGAVLAVLMQGPRRFNELLNTVPGLSDRLLTERLRELEDNGIVERRIFAERPVRIEYALTPAGLDLDQLIKVITAWGQKWRPEPSQGSAKAQEGRHVASRKKAPSRRSA
jgi:DNA-binding HxlR family transcriptional regulator